jgi:glutamate carboxypeptidase
MNIADLPFDPAAILADVKPWVACESPSWDAAAVSRMTTLAAADLRQA